eukprot:scaffold12694_cov141-Skeletonema_marinoi.AAC.11
MIRLREDDMTEPAKIAITYLFLPLYLSVRSSTGIGAAAGAGMDLWVKVIVIWVLLVCGRIMCKASTLIERKKDCS